jgi:hypothetical protein
MLAPFGASAPPCWCHESAISSHSRRITLEPHGGPSSHIVRNRTCSDKPAHRAAKNEVEIRAPPELSYVDLGPAPACQFNEGQKAWTSTGAHGCSACSASARRTSTARRPPRDDRRRSERCRRSGFNITRKVGTIEVCSSPVHAQTHAEQAHPSPSWPCGSIS